MLLLPIEARIKLDQLLARVQTRPTETPLVRELLEDAPVVVRDVLAPYARSQGADVIVGSLLCHGSPLVRWEDRYGREGGGPELADLLVVAAFVHGGALVNTRARLFQAKTHDTRIDEYQYWLYRHWPPFEIYRPNAADYTWWIAPETADMYSLAPIDSPGYTYDPEYLWSPPIRRRGTSYLWVEPGASPVTTYVPSRSSDDLELTLNDDAALGWFLCDMLSDGAGREFAISAPEWGRNGWDELVTYLLLRAGDPAAQTRWALPQAPDGLLGGSPRPYSSAFVHSLADEPDKHLGEALAERAGSAGDRARHWARGGAGEDVLEQSDEEPSGGVLAIIIASQDGRE